MVEGITKAAAYSKAPVTTFAVPRPLKAAKWGGIFLLGGMALKRTARRMQATKTR